MPEALFGEYDFCSHVRVDEAVCVLDEADDEQDAYARRIDAEEEEPVFEGERQVEEGCRQNCNEEGVGQERDDGGKPLFAVKAPVKDLLLQKSLQLAGQRTGRDGKHDAGGKEDCGEDACRPCCFGRKELRPDHGTVSPCACSAAESTYF